MVRALGAPASLGWRPCSQERDPVLPGLVNVDVINPSLGRKGETETERDRQRETERERDGEGRAGGVRDWEGHMLRLVQRVI